MILEQTILKEKQRLLKRKCELEELIKAAPPGKLIVGRAKIKGKLYNKWYHSVLLKGSAKRQRFYIPREKKSLAIRLAHKKLYNQQLHDINCELSAIDSYLAKHCEPVNITEFMTQPSLRDLFSEDENCDVITGSLQEELQKWQHESYDTNPYYREHLTIKSVDGIMVRSKSEAMILMMLSHNHIPYRYECALEINGYIYYPDFTIRHPITGETFYWEHVGRLDKIQYRSDYISKLRTYINNGILPDINLIQTYEDDTHPLNLEIVEDKLKEFFGCDKS